MASIVWHPNSIEDLKLIKAYLSRNSPNFARNFLQQIKNLINNLSIFPLMGRIVPELNISNYRELIIQNYRIIYYFAENQIEILAILHSKQQFSP